MSSFERLHPHVQHALVNDLGWRSLRPVQELTIDAVLDGCNAVVLAPTAGGKTEAAAFPILSRILTESIQPVAALYVCPIRALLNNQEPRLGHYTRMVGLEAFKWHGDVSESKRARFRQSPAHLLMTTPESIEVMLISERTDARRLFASLSVVVIDEVHAFAGDDRGAHLASLLERITHFCGRDIQRIGLSATVGNPETIGEWLQGSSARPFRLVDPPRSAPPREISVAFPAEVSDAARDIARVARGRKSLVFVESRSQAERVAHAMNGMGVDVFVHHSSVSRADRTLAEERFTSGENTAIVCTSTMELGIDVGDLDQVLQVDAPSAVASFLQRIGRTGRREGTGQRCGLYCLTPEALLQAVAVLRLAARGWVEDVKPPREAMHVLAHQVLALTLQENGLSRHRVLDWLRPAYPFAGLSEERVQGLIETMLERDILHEADGLLSLGAKGEELYGRKHFFELYAVFSSPPMLHVVHGKDEIGYLQMSFALLHDRKEGPLSFRLAGRPWQAVDTDWSRGVLHVVPAEHGRVPSWSGSPGSLSFEICQEMRAALVEPGPEAAWLGAEAIAELESLRRGYGGLLELERAPLEERGKEIIWHTFAGGTANRLLAVALEAETGHKWTVGNLTLKCSEIGLVAARGAVRKLATVDWDALAQTAARGLARGPISKFQPCLDESDEANLLAQRLLDANGVARQFAWPTTATAGHQGDGDGT